MIKECSNLVVNGNDEGMTCQLVKIILHIDDSCIYQNKRVFGNEYELARHKVD